MPAAIHRQEQKGTETDIDRLRSTIRKHAGRQRRDKHNSFTGKDRDKKTGTVRHLC